MKKSLFFLFFFISVSVLKAQNLDTASLNAAFSKVKKEKAPDKRSVHFVLSYKQDTAIIESSSEEAIKAFNMQFKAENHPKIKRILLPDANLKGKIYGVANLSVANNRLNPAHSAELVTQILMGTPVEVLKKQSGFFYVRTPEGYLSWVDGAAIKDMTLEELQAWKAAEKIIISADYGHVYSEPNKESARVSDLVSGNILKNIGETGSFIKVEFPDKRTGYVEKNKTESYKIWLSKGLPNAGNILNSANKFIGVPYLWGGTSIKGMDCSGFTKTAFFLNGIILPRDASQQVLVGTPVEVITANNFDVDKAVKNLLPGDLLFFAGSKKPGSLEGRITHVAIYMGDGKMIQSAGMVKISSLYPNDPTYDTAVSNIVSAKRVLNNVGNPEITKVENHGWYK